jgi:hypothetical protein
MEDLYNNGREKKHLELITLVSCEDLLNGPTKELQNFAIKIRSWHLWQHINKDTRVIDQERCSLQHLQWRNLLSI